MGSMKLAFEIRSRSTTYLSSTSSATLSFPKPGAELHGAELLFEIVSQAHGRPSLIVTSNLPFEHWSKVMGSERITRAKEITWQQPSSKIDLIPSHS
jgi:hypothetical protein